MRTFITWSGEISHGVALELREFLRLIFPAVDPFVSSQDIRKGAQWRSAISAALGESQRGIICLTSDNYAEPWVLFEAGALSKSLEKPVLYTILIGDLEPEGLQGSPLSAFQHTRLNRNDLKELVTSMNEELEPRRVERDVETLFDSLWPDFETRVASLLQLNAGARRVVRIAELARDSAIIAGRMFTDVIIRGPAVLALLEQCRFLECRFNSPGPSEMLWRPESKAGGIGAIGVTRCQFERCNFEGIGFSGSEETLMALMQVAASPAGVGTT